VPLIVVAGVGVGRFFVSGIVRLGSHVNVKPVSPVRSVQIELTVIAIVITVSPFAGKVVVVPIGVDVIDFDVVLPQVCSMLMLPAA
jgi:hypothetical protein